MSLITCPECKKEISDEANSCPNCGFPIKKSTIQQKPQEEINKRISYKRIYFYLLIIAFVLSIISVIVNSGSTSDLADPTKELVAKLIYGVPFTACICSLPTFVILGGAIELYYRVK